MPILLYSYIIVSQTLELFFSDLIKYQAGSLKHFRKFYLIGVVYIVDDDFDFYVASLHEVLLKNRIESRKDEDRNDDGHDQPKHTATSKCYFFPGLNRLSKHILFPDIHVIASVYQIAPHIVQFYPLEHIQTGFGDRPIQYCLDFIHERDDSEYFVGCSVEQAG